MRVFALSDPHLSFGTPDRTMDRFGPQWVDHPTTMARAWDAMVGTDDVVLVPGDISWARNAEQVGPDLEWLAARPGTKILGKGNHESWWPKSRARRQALLPDGLLSVDGDALRVGDLAVGGTRLWDSPEVRYHDQIVWQGEPISPEMDPATEAAALKVFDREVGRLERALPQIDRSAPLRIAMVHHPPLNPGPTATSVTPLFEAAGVSHVVFGHLHSLDEAQRETIGGTLNGVTYVCASCDWIGFAPVLVAEV